RHGAARDRERPQDRRRLVPALPRVGARLWVRRRVDTRGDDRRRPLPAGPGDRPAAPRRPRRARAGRRLPSALGLGRAARGRALRGARLRAADRERTRGDDAAHVRVARGLKKSSRASAMIARVRVLVVVCAAVCCLNAAAAAPPASWTTFGNEPTRAGDAGSVTPQTLARDFVLPLDGRIVGQVLAANGTFYAATT